MTGQANVTDVQSIEEFTVYSLDRSSEGLDALIAECRRCGEAMIGAPIEAMMTYLPPVAEQLHAFQSFEISVSSLFQLEPELIADEKGSLKDMETNLNELLHQLTEMLLASDYGAVSEMLRCDVPQILARYQTLLPILRHYIDVEYMQTPEVAG